MSRRTSSPHAVLVFFWRRGIVCGMPDNFLDRLRAYYLDVAKVLRGEADAAKIFPNSTDKGGSRERIYIEFLRQHAAV